MSTNKPDKVRKVLNFDLDTKELKKHFADYTEAYRKMRKTLTDEGFEHRQGSGYVSKEPLAPFEISILIEQIVVKNPWLATCVNEFDVSDIPLNMFSIKDMIKSFDAQF